MIPFSVESSFIRFVTLLNVFLRIMIYSIPSKKWYATSTHHLVQVGFLPDHRYCDNAFLPPWFFWYISRPESEARESHLSGKTFIHVSSVVAGPQSPVRKTGFNKWKLIELYNNSELNRVIYPTLKRVILQSLLEMTADNWIFQTTKIMLPNKVPSIRTYHTSIMLQILVR